MNNLSILWAKVALLVYAALPPLLSPKKKLATRLFQPSVDFPTQLPGFGEEV